MALAVYQEVLCRMVADSEYRALIAANPLETLQALDLTGLERLRLSTIARHRGLAVSGAIHRANRLLPLDHTLPFTCFLLGTQLRNLVDRYWKEHPAENLQLPAECERFGQYLAAAITAGRATGPYLAEVLAFERAATELRFFADDGGPRRDPRNSMSRVRVVPFHHHPVPLLEALSQRHLPPPDLETGDFQLLIDCRSGEPEFRLLDGDAAAALQQAAGAKR